MSADRFIYDIRNALTSLVGTGAVSADDNTVAGFRTLARRAHGLGLSDLGGHLDQLASHLSHRGSLGFDASMPIANEICTVHDRIEALSTALALWSIGTSDDSPLVP